jgi:thiamine kinase-like enzyme
VAVRHEAILGRVWPGRELASEPLGGGITNHNFLVRVDADAFVLRIGGKDTQALGIDRSAEAAAARMAAEVGVGPEVVAVGEPEGYLITRFIDGEPISADRMRTPEVLRPLTEALRAIHSGPWIPGRFNPHRVVEAYQATARAHGVAIPDEYRWAHGVSDRIERARGPQPEVPCHDDLLNANFIWANSRVWIVDWEYAGMGDRFFDLGNLSIKHGFEVDDDEALLEAYFGRVEAGHLASVRLMRFMGAFFESMWGVVQQGISELDFDFRAYARENFDRLRTIAGDPRFEGWMRTAALRT